MLPTLAYLDIYLELENPDSAEAALIGVEQLIQALGVEALRRRVVNARGRIHELRGQYQDAIAQYRRELELAPTNLEVHTAIGRAYRQLGELDDAAEHINATLRVHPFDPEAHYELALVYADDGDYDKAGEHLETALSIWDEADAEYRPAADARTKLAELQGGA